MSVVEAAAMRPSSCPPPPSPPSPPPPSNSPVICVALLTIPQQHNRTPPSLRRTFPSPRKPPLPRPRPSGSPFRKPRPSRRRNTGTSPRLLPRRSRKSSCLFRSRRNRRNRRRRGKRRSSSRRCTQNCTCTFPSGSRTGRVRTCSRAVKMARVREGERYAEKGGEKKQGLV